ncbi:hypothetical protein [Paraburkholderia sp. C35]|uniref:hypothetical protein n=1 Tax=Paraburkholderia sp. C35 TaxID=2126993 RepID=UPI000D692E3E|nr:hypothetical protein [Paraburkholderia sp. C35]
MTTLHQPTAEHSIDPTGSLVNVLPIAHRAGALLNTTAPILVPFHAFSACCDRADARSSRGIGKKSDGLWRDLARHQVTV